MKNTKILNIVILFFLVNVGLWSNAATSYVSDIDKELAVKKIIFPQGADNIKGIFAQPLTDYLVQKIKDDKIWDLIDCKKINPVQIDELIDNPTTVTQMLKQCNADGVLILNVLKGPGGTQLKLGFFTSSGFLFSLKDSYIVETQNLNSLKNEIMRLYESIHEDFPFQGLVLSRTGNKVSISRGHDFGVALDQEYSIVQVVSIERHPKFNFIINSKKEILGKVHITKVDETMSFGYLVFEKENNIVDKNMKVVLLNPKEYPSLANSKNEDVIEHLAGREDSGLMMGKNNEEWRPVHKPTFGKVAFDFGLGSYITNSNLILAGGISGKASLALSMDLLSEIWITPTYFFQLDYGQGAATIKNDLANSTPSNLNIAITKYNLLLGMNIFMEGENYFGPKIQIMAGLANFQTKADESTPTAFTSMVYSGISVGIRGFLPWSEESPLTFGAESYYSIMPTTSESPVTSGNEDKTNVLSFSGFAQYKLKENVNFIGKIISDSYSTNFSGTGTRQDSSTNISHAWARISAGIEYYF